MTLFELPPPDYGSSELAELAAEVAKDLPASVRKVIDTAIENGWELNKPGMTLALRLNHPTDELAQPVYVTWAVGRTPSGKLSFRFMSCGTRGLVPLSGADLLEYLADPTVAYMTDDDAAQASTDREAKEAAKADEKRAPWDKNADPVTNLHTQLGAQVVRIEKTRAPSRAATSPVRTGAQPLRVAAPALRVQAPKAH